MKKGFWQQPQNPNLNRSRRSIKTAKSMIAHLEEKSNRVPLNSHEEPIDPHDLNDVGNSKRILAHRGQDMRYCHDMRKWLTWDGQRWTLDRQGTALACAKDTFASLNDQASDQVGRLNREFAKCEDDERKKQIESTIKKLQALQGWYRRSHDMRRLKSALESLASERSIPVLPENLDSDPWALTCPNGVLDLRTGKLRAPKREDLFTKACPVEYHPQAIKEAVIWEGFLATIFKGNTDLIDYVQRLLGYCLTGLTTEQILVVFWGTGANGKSVLTNTLLNVLGTDFAGKCPRGFLTKSSKNEHRTIEANLQGKRLMVSSETSQGQRFDESLVKDLTGSEPITARRMREDFWQFTPSHKLILSTNYRPRVQESGHAIWRRLRLIPFEVTIPEHEQDKELEEKLKQESAGILAWLVEGCTRWQEQGLDTPDCVRLATDEYREEEDIVGRWIEDCVTRTEDEKDRVKASQLYANFKSWCEANEDVGRTPSLTEFGETLVQDKGFKRKRSGGVFFYLNVRAYTGQR